MDWAWLGWDTNADWFWIVGHLAFGTMPLNPLPFRLHPTGRDAIGFEGIESVSYRLSGLLRLADQCVILEWTGTRTIEQLSLDKVGTDVEQLPMEWFELPYERIAGAWVVGGWWRPRLELRAREDGDFTGMPSSRGVTLPLRIHRRDCGVARGIASEIDARVAATVPACESHSQRGASELE